MLPTPLRSLLLAVAVGAVTAPGLSAQRREVLPLPRIDSLVRAEMATQRIPGVAVAIVLRDSVHLAAGWGYANVEHQVPVSDRTIFQSGSVGKQFTAAATLALVDDGRLRLDDPLLRWIPDAGRQWRDVTIRHLLSHTSGIPTYSEDLINYRQDYSEADLVRLVRTLRPDFAPGERFSYSNTGFILLGIIVRAVSGEFYGDFLRARVWQPLGMPTARVISELDIVPHRAAGYTLDGDSLRNQSWVSPVLNTTADGSLYLSLRDYIAWDRGIRRGAVLSDSSWRVSFTRAPMRDGRTAPYGFGWFVDSAGGAAYHHHGGSWQGFQVFFGRYAKHDLSIVVLTNLAQGDPQRISEQIAMTIDPSLATPLPPEASREALELRVRAVLAKAASGRLTRSDFSWTPQGFFPDSPRAFRRLLAPLGNPVAIVLERSARIGDDIIAEHSVRYATRTVTVVHSFAPDGTLTLLQIFPQ